MSNLTVFCIVYQEFVLDYCHCFRKPDAMFIFIFSQTSVKLNGKKKSTLGTCTLGLSNLTPFSSLQFGISSSTKVQNHLTVWLRGHGFTPA